MNETTKTILIVGGVALVGYLAYKKFTAPKVLPNPVTQSTAGTGQSVGAATHTGTQGETSFWNQLGSLGSGLNSAVSAVESTYNSIYGGPDTSATNTGQGNNGTGG